MSMDVRCPDVFFTPGQTLLSHPPTRAIWDATALKAQELAQLLSDISDPVLLEGGALRQALEGMALASAGRLGPCDDWPLLRQSARFWDYAEADALVRDAQDMRAYASQDGPPPSFELAALSMPSAGACADSALVEAVLELFRCRGHVPFHDQQVCRKLVPSLGARHGLNCHVLSREAGHFALRCTRVHEHVGLVEGPLIDGRWVLDEAACLIGVRFDHYQWRYRTAWVYQCIYLDLGHVVSALRLLCGRAGRALRIRHCPAFEAAGFRELVQEPILLIELDSTEEQCHA